MGVRRLLGCLMALACGSCVAGNVKTPVKNFYELDFIALEQKPFPEGFFKNKVILVVNTASKCGYTPQYAELQKLYEKYQKEGLIVLAIPSRDFMEQEFKDQFKIRQFTEEKFNVTFPIADIGHVRGKNRHEFYDWVEEELGYFSLPWWNFHKYLVDREGHLVASFGTRTTPLDVQIVEQLEKALADKAI